MTTRSFRNPIMRQIQRHAHLAAIYRVAEPSGSTASGGPARFSAGTTPAAVPIPTRAYLWPAVDVSSPDASEQSDAVPPLRAIPPQSSPDQTGPVQAPAPGVQRAPAQPLAEATTAQKSTTNQPAPKPAGLKTAAPQTPQAAIRPPAAPASEPEAGDEIDASTWLRLQTIFHRHQEGQAGSDEPIRSSKAVGSTGPASSSEPLSADAPAHATPPATPDDKDSASARTLIQRRLASPSAGQPGSVQDAPAEPAVESTADQDPFLPGWTETEEAAADNRAADGNIATAENTAAKGDPTDAYSAAFDLDQPVQRLPLEAAWPVERSRPPAAKTDSSEPQMPRTLPEPGTEPDAGDVIRLRSTLAQVSSEQPSASSIELVPPRRARPILLTPPSRVETHPGQRSADIQKQDLELPQAAPGAPGYSPDQAASFAAPLHAAGQPAFPASRQESSESVPELAIVPHLIQRKADGEAGPGSPIAETAPAGMVPTGIGALPADLWTLIGQPAPQPTAQAGHPQSPPPADAPGQFTREPEFTAPPAAVIQRAQDAEAPTPAQPGGQPIRAAGQAEGLSQANQPDIDQLARSVYADVRRRLNQEWERMRRH